MGRAGLPGEKVNIVKCKLINQSENSVCEALLDTGSGVNFISAEKVKNFKVDSKIIISVQMLDSSVVRSMGVVTCRFLCGEVKFSAEFHVMKTLCCEVIFGETTLREFPQLWSMCSLQEEEEDLSQVKIENDDFIVIFEDKKWTLEWKWKRQPEYLSNRIAEYKMSADVQADYEAEIDRWIHDGILVEHNEEVKGLIPLMSVVQVNKKKVRPVMDYRELNNYLQSHVGDAIVCGEKLRKWRRFSSKISIVDLKAAYLQIFVKEELQSYQVVKFRDKYYRMTRMCFGMVSGPKVMNAILSYILNLNESTAQGTDSYIDDIIIDESIVSSDEVVKQLSDFGLRCKPTESVNDVDAVRILGLLVKNESKKQRLEWTRGNLLEEIDVVTRRELFSYCGKLCSHYPVAGWLRVACSFVKRTAGQCCWDDPIGPHVLQILCDIRRRVQECDPVGGIWNISGEETKGEVWFDASSLALGVLVRIGGNVVEDASWLRPVGEVLHINLAELNAAVKGLNLDMLWGLKEITMFTDSSSCYSWLNDTISMDKRIRTKGISEMLIRRRLAVVSELMEAYDLKIKVVLVSSAKNLADPLTRVPSLWLKNKHVSAVATVEEVHPIHDEIHMGVDRTQQLCIMSGLDDTKDLRECVQTVVRKCDVCNSIDPAPVYVPHGSTKVIENWARLAVDFTHFEGITYLTLLDCGSGYMIWRRTKSETADVAIKELQQIFIEWGPPKELLSDHVPFSSASFQEFLNYWKVKWIARCANRPQGNPVERSHRTIKCLAARSGKEPDQVTFWYNRTSVNAKSKSPFEKLSSGGRAVRIPFLLSSDCDDILQDENTYCFLLGQRVFVKPDQHTKCTKTWRGPFEVTKIYDEYSIEVDNDGIRRHISHVRVSEDESS